MLTKPLPCFLPEQGGKLTIAEVGHPGRFFRADMPVQVFINKPNDIRNSLIHLSKKSPFIYKRRWKPQFLSTFFKRMFSSIMW